MGSGKSRSLAGCEQVARDDAGDGNAGELDGDPSASLCLASKILTGQCQRTGDTSDADDGDARREVSRSRSLDYPIQEPPQEAQEFSEAEQRRSDTKSIRKNGDDNYRCRSDDVDGESEELRFNCVILKAFVE